ncbi:maltose O-acetyltransferase [Nakamurella sp. UYEF19]|uniref:acyltransferase n=1 Tax=Nakamurella sp. UYEF19 TaxID=1756392 RepID=UPI003395EF1C
MTGPDALAQDRRGGEMVAGANFGGRRWSWKNLSALVRLVKLGISYPQLRSTLFFIDRNADVVIAPGAKVTIGRELRIMRDVTIRVGGELVLGDRVFFNRGCNLNVLRRVVIGSDSLIGEMVSIHDDDHAIGAEFDGTPMGERPMIVSDVVIGSNVWIGSHCTIVRGVHIGDGAVIGANSVVTRDVEPRTVVAGAPARLLRRI